MGKATLPGPIVTGYDGSPAADYALRWAVREASLRNVPLQVVHVVEWPVTAAPGETQWLSGQQRQRMQQELDAAAANASGFTGQVTILEGSVVGTLCRLSEEAGLLVCGSRGIGGFTGLLVGSTSSSVAVHARCPVVVVRGGEAGPAPESPIVVGVDESEPAQLAAQFAFAEASARDCEVLAVRAWHPGPDPLGEIYTAEHHALHRSLDLARQHYPEVKYSLRLAADRPGKALIDASQDAQLVVTGARGRGGFTGLLLGSVGLQLIHHAHCPVAVVR